MFLRRTFSLACIIITLWFCLGCGPRTAGDREQAPAWMPKNPSPAFQRANKLLRPLSPDSLRSIAREFPGGAASVKAYCRTFPALYEVFGSLTEAQLHEFDKADQVEVSMKELTAEQRRAVEHWFDLWQKEMKHAPAEVRDYRDLLVKSGAAKDFTNVELGFRLRSNMQSGLGLVGESVSIVFRMQSSNGDHNHVSSIFAERR